MRGSEVRTPGKKPDKFKLKKENFIKDQLVNFEIRSS